MFDPGIMQSPLIGVDESDNEHVATHSGTGLKLIEIPYLSHFNLRGNGQNSGLAGVLKSIMNLHLPLTPNTVSESDEAVICWLSHDEWLIMSQQAQTPDKTRDKLQAMRESLQGEHIALTDVGSGQTVIRISGERALLLLAKATPFDLHPQRFGLRQCAQTLVAKTNALILPRASNEPVYDLIVRRSFADYLWCWLIDAAREFES